MYRIFLFLFWQSSWLRSRPSLDTTVKSDFPNGIHGTVFLQCSNSVDEEFASMLRCSMYGIVTYIWLKFTVNVGTYSGPMENLGMLSKYTNCHGCLCKYDTRVMLLGGSNLKSY